MQLELGNMVKTGELIQLWDVACQTNLQFNLVRRVSRDCLWLQLRDCLNVLACMFDTHG